MTLYGHSWRLALAPLIIQTYRTVSAVHRGGAGWGRRMSGLSVTTMWVCIKHSRSPNYSPSSCASTASQHAKKYRECKVKGVSKRSLAASQDFRKSLGRLTSLSSTNGQRNCQYTAEMPIRPIGLNTLLSLSGLSVSPRNNNSAAPLTVQVPKLFGMQPIIGNAPFCCHLETARPYFDTSLIWHILYFPHDPRSVSALFSYSHMFVETS